MEKITINGVEYKLTPIENESPNSFEPKFKVGDVIFAKSKFNGDSFIRIFLKLDGDKSWAYCNICSNGYFDPSKGFLQLSRYDFYPATKEQRNLLFTKMKEAGYEWDAEKKELKKIEDEEYNGEDYGIDGLWHAKNILEKTLGKVGGYQTDDGILSHQCAITAVKKLYKQKTSEWCEEDKRMFDYALDMVEWYGGKNEKRVRLVSDWLKSLRPQPKQEWSEKDEKMFRRLHNLIYVVRDCDCDSRGKKELSDWLNSLKQRIGG